MSETKKLYFSWRPNCEGYQNKETTNKQLFRLDSMHHTKNPSLQCDRLRGLKHSKPVWYELTLIVIRVCGNGNSDTVLLHDIFI